VAPDVRPRPRWGSLQPSTDPQLYLRGHTSKGRERKGEGKGRGEKGKQSVGEGKGGEGCPNWGVWIQQ